MTDRDKIAEIIRNARMNANPLSQIGYAEADALLSNGVIVPPCKVGDKVYYIHETYWDKDYKNQVINDNVRNRILKIVERQNHATNLALEVIHFDYCFIIDWTKFEDLKEKVEWLEIKLEESDNNAR